MKQIYFAMTLFFTLTLTACSASIDAGKAQTTPPPPAEKIVNLNPEQPIPLIISTADKMISNEFNINSNKADYMVVYELSAASENMILRLGKYTEGFSGCYPGDVKVNLWWGTKNSSGEIISMQQLTQYSTFYADQGRSYALLIALKGTQNCFNYQYQFVVLK